MKDNIILRIGSGAFLRNNDHYLLLKRSPEKDLAPNVWSCIGGHMEENELGNPFETCIREINEETGITKEHIFNLKLRYIMVRKYKNTIRQYFIYFGETDADEIVNSKEGTLHWIKEEELLTKEYSRTFAEMLKHYFQNKSEPEEKIIVGVAGGESNELKMSWSILEDYEHNV
jgi:8-oxo-dGTP diphosphatase